MNGCDLFTELVSRPPLSALPPQLRVFLKDYLSAEKARLFDGRWVINMHLPPYPSRAFEGLVAQFLGGEEGAQRLYSVTWAVTNRCDFGCWHCYNSGRSPHDVPLARMRQIAQGLQERGACMVTLSGGEPLLRRDLEEIAASFDERACLVLNTTGWGLTESRAQALRQAGVFAMGISLDSELESEHDRLRGRSGAFQSALRALATARDAGLYPYVVTVARRELLPPERFLPFLDLAARHGAQEVHLVEPSATGRLANRTDVLLTEREREQLLTYQSAVVLREDLPILSTLTHLESPQAFGCGAGLTHLYIDGSGELSPCNLVPLSFGNLAREDLATALERMSRCFRRPRATCVGHVLSRHIPAGALPTSPEASRRLCSQHLPQAHPLPRFFRLRAAVAEMASAATIVGGRP